MREAPSILYIEDDELNRRLVHRVLAPHGYKMLEAADGLSGIQLAQLAKPDLILMDINLPDIDGLAATVKLKSIPDLADVPIVAITAGGFDRARERSLTMGCSGFITKPIDVKTFPTRIRAFLDGYREEVARSVGRQTAEIFMREESLALVSRLEEKIRELTVAKRDLETANQALASAFDELKRAHDAERKLHKAQSAFLAVSSHELRTPLAVITGYLDLLLAGQLGPPPPQIDRVLQVTHRNALRLSTIVTALAEVARIESVGLDLRLGPTSLPAILEDQLSDMSPALATRQLTARLELEAGLPPVRGDRERLGTLFQSLLMNAIRFTPDGGSITVSARERGAMIEVRVTDTGIGLSLDDMERIFEPFFRVQDALHHSSGTFEFQSGGIGLGLTLARGIVLAHHGEIRVESAGESSGSTFVVTLPKASTAQA